MRNQYPEHSRVSSTNNEYTVNVYDENAKSGHIKKYPFSYS